MKSIGKGWRVFNSAHGHINYFFNEIKQRPSFSKTGSYWRTRLISITNSITRFSLTHTNYRRYFQIIENYFQTKRYCSGNKAIKNSISGCFLPCDASRKRRIGSIQNRKRPGRILRIFDAGGAALRDHDAYLLPDDQSLSPFDRNPTSEHEPGHTTYNSSLWKIMKICLCII